MRANFGAGMAFRSARRVLDARRDAWLRCSSLGDWRVYPRLAHIMQASDGGAQRGADAPLPAAFIALAGTGRRAAVLKPRR